MSALFQTTRGRLTLISVAILAMALLLADAGLYFGFTFSQRAEADAQLKAQAEAVARGLKVADGRVTYRTGDLPHETRSGVAIDLAVVGPSGVVTGTADDPLNEATLADLSRPVLRSTRPIWVDLDDAKRVHRRVYAAPLTQELGQPLVLVASTPLGELESSVARTMALVGLLSLLVLGAGGLLVYWLVGRVLSPVGKIASLAETLSERDLHRRVELKAPHDELGALVETFNRMLARLESSFQTLRRFTADASHELRTPLALIRTEVELSLSKRRSRADYERVLRVVQSEVVGINSIVDQLLLLARADIGELRPRREAIDVADFVHETAAKWAGTMTQSGLHLEVIAPDEGELQADPSLTRRILDNLIDNAIRHSPPGGQVRLRAASEGDGWLFEVADQGTGVPVAERSRIFLRFARADNARTRDRKGGTGLGLALSAAFAQVQGGDVRLADSNGWGAVFQVWLPARADPARERADSGAV